MNLENLIESFLDELEMIESRLLCWGVVETSFSEDELFKLVDDFLLEHDSESVVPDPSKFLNILEERVLIYCFSDESGNPRYRTRMAECVRLMFKNRQLLMKHRQGNSWSMAPELVSDFRFMKRPRSYPKRDILLTDFIGRLKRKHSLSKIQESLLSTLFEEQSKNALFSQFQVSSSEIILGHLKQTVSHGSIICAGTGSGKTWAFYIPALLDLVGSISKSPSDWVRVMALYPRNELLKDQFSELFKLTRMINRMLEQVGLRKIKIGAFFGDTVQYPKELILYDSKRWLPVKGREAFICPYLVCPQTGCDGRLLWHSGDIEQGIERLKCENCDTWVGADELALSRESMKKSSPDILFTTTEMLNQRMGDSTFNHLFGCGEKKGSLRLVLLDEVHTYSGVHGAQVALLIRRWRMISKLKVQFVGLSATLKEAKPFFSNLTGVPESFVEKIEPSDEEIEYEGSEYIAVLQGNPTAMKALLSTSLQTAMLLGRMLDPIGKQTSDGFFGQKVFAFTDDLDVTNRFFFNLQDAEGKDSFGNFKQDSLAILRNHIASTDYQRYQHGQTWEICNRIGHRLDEAGLVIGRTSSQDLGVLEDANVVVATASLEVGYNDTTVGAILQHKTPRDNAQFLQRKGRAGRSRKMRPWMIVVLSDYGRDRLAFQSYDQIFDPELSHRDLPIRNKYVLKIQSVYALMDWFSLQLSKKDVPAGSLWSDLAVPWSLINSVKRQEMIKRRQMCVSKIVNRVLEEPSLLEDLKTYIEQSLRIDESTCNSLLWEAPRPIITSVLPTLKRRLESGWKRGGMPANDHIKNNHPLPEFVPANLFSDLNLPEVIIPVERQKKSEEDREISMPILQALSEFAPGRVSKRFGIVHAYARHWTFPEPYSCNPNMNIDLNHYCGSKNDYLELGDFKYWESGKFNSIRCIRPIKLRVQKPPRYVGDTSYSSLDWKTEIVTPDSAVLMELPKPNRFNGIINELSFFTHNCFSPIEIRRFAFKANTVIQERTQQKTVEFRFMDQEDSEAGVPVAVGFNLDVDAFRVKLAIPEHFHNILMEGGSEKIRAVRSNLFFHSIRNSQELPKNMNNFQRDWLAQVYLAAKTAQASNSSIPLEEMWNSTSFEEELVYCKEIIKNILQISIEEGPDETPIGVENLETVLSDLISESRIQQIFHEHSKILFQTPYEGWKFWLRETYATTLGIGILEAIQNLCPDMDINDLVLDLMPVFGPEGAINPNEIDLWFSESTIGGGGLVEKIQVRYGENPKHFFDLIENALRRSDREMVDEHLQLFLSTASKDSKFSDCIKEFRDCKDNLKKAEQLNRLKVIMAEKGISRSHHVMTAINSRILKPGSNSKTDDALCQLIEYWNHLENRFGIEINGRIAAYLCSKNSKLVDAFSEAVGDMWVTGEKISAYTTFYSLLWPRGSMLRAQRLGAYSPYFDFVPTDSLLVRDFLKSDTEKVAIDLESDEWKKEAYQVLVKEGVVSLVFDKKSMHRIKSIFNTLMLDPVDVGFLFFYPRLRKIEQNVDNMLFTFEIFESIQ